MTIIGITGPTGAGKTTALREIEKLGGAVIDCDAVYHDLLERDITLQGMLESALALCGTRAGPLTGKSWGPLFSEIRRSWRSSIPSPRPLPWSVPGNCWRSTAQMGGLW